MSRKDDSVTIIIPVYADWPSLETCINSLKKHVTEQHKILLVNDCGPEADLLEKNIKQSIKDFPNFNYFRNEQNLGFVKTCNRAVFELDKSNNEVLLLNSDTEVTEGFLEEMLEVLHSDNKIGAVSPRSNNASIFTVPLSTAVKKGIDPKWSYEVFQKIKNRLPKYNILPVTNGFCMLICRGVIKKHGLFDDVFGKGYGEEVDFCQRILRHGYISAASNWSYVFHLEAKSFSLETKKKLMEEHNQILWERYPNYRQSVRDYMDTEIAKERKIEEEAGANLSYANETQVKRIIKRNPKIYRLARRIRRGKEK